ncbi:MAG: helix-turn-helix domain-containing protein [Deltaproteobacteria bacterium]|nr:helix-turn-helix domain-containing protein [Deltaproteobacteria bacterium]
MESPGEYLKREREIRGIPLEDISNATKVRVGLLTAIERNDFDVLPSAPFVKGFIQAYCKYLGLDVQDALLRYEAYIRIAEDETSAMKQKSGAITQPPIKPGVENSVSYSQLSIIGIAAIALLIIVGGVYIISKSKRQPSATPDSSVRQVDGSSNFQTRESQTGHRVGREVIAKKEASSLPTKSEAQSNPTHEASASKVSIKKENKDAKDMLPDNVVIDKGPLVLIIEATKPTWIKAEVDGMNPFEVSLKQGEKIKWNAKERFSILIGNAGGVNVIFNDNLLGSLGDEGKVVKLVLPKERLQTPDSRPQTQN